MESEYEWEVNEIQDMLMQVLVAGGDISEKNMLTNIRNFITEYLKNYLNNEGDLIYLDFNIKKSDIYYKVIGNNMASALWLSGIFPDDPYGVCECNECYVENVKYTFNPKTKTLKYKIV